ncbi:response regulator [Dactylosporangium salmoneum]|uniref:response regulator n=1 Tax=Dactylosporangium salmoneum TaxID=53361 RepID=UPI0031CE58AC
MDGCDPVTRSIRDLLEREGIEVLGVASSFAEALRQFHDLRPDVVLVDLCLGAESGFDLARKLSSVREPPMVILMSTRRQDDYEELIAASPAVGFLSKIAVSSGAIRNLITTARNRPHTDGVVRR